MKPVYLSAWGAHTGSVTNWLESLGFQAKNETVWQGDDGSYAVGDAGDIYDDDPKIDLGFWTDRGTVAEWLESRE